ncbi:PD-(D/E)XK nuclease family protein [Leadbettera azotonutricia]|uniref:PD-(D/E)XK endonuclease-like domain-containing protein n=1 Tax=Leadbettera azotonutricia (strain ATCC BAA-888 / DSM 13862 / ZAS-9) TaxID=545695 RepID=F5YEF3_LEAAZ|nr:PD-(D/E)XK nuclease family protein [Leadbettera azotonutricia]AEF80533.1 conserved hypothetical protein [Leadbettera azotonutricia ZAS-9]
MNIIVETIKREIANQEVRFVFPSGLAADLWARRTCTLGLARSIAGNRFLAWDYFKEEVIREEVKDKSPASQVVRKLFAELLVKKNAEATILENADKIRQNVDSAGRPRRGASGFPLLAVIPPEHAKGGSVFTASIAQALPSLAYWENLKSNTRRENDDEDKDYEIIKKEYKEFLDHYKFFEPSWEKAKIKTGKIRYIIFFPELIEDFQEYAELLKPPLATKILLDSLEPARPELLLYKSVREEIRSAVLEIRRLHQEQKIPYEKIAISLPGLEDMEPCLIRELSLFHIPYIRRAGKKLGENSIGRLFSRINDCAANSFSFNSLKALILSDLPWKNPESNDALINFGIVNNCVSPYSQGKDLIDVWESAFKDAYKDEEKKLASYYWDLKRKINDLAGSKTLKDIRKYYFAFRRLLDMDKISDADNAVLGRCIEELNSLIELEDKLGDAILQSPLNFYISLLGEKSYVPAGQKPGVNIFPWRVAAASPFQYHFVLNASQNDSMVLYQSLKFLGQDKRKLLNLEDHDATPAFFLLCNAGRISASTQTFSGWTIPHSFFAGGKGLTVKPPATPDDPYRHERQWWAGDRAGKDFAKEIFALQKEGFDHWSRILALRGGKSFSFFISPLIENGIPRELLDKRIWRQDEKSSDPLLIATPTKDLNDFFKCPVLWLYKRIFGVEEFYLEAKLLDDESLGILYHNILKELFEKIKKEDHSFKAARLKEYKKWVIDIAKTCIKKDRTFKGPLALPLLTSQAAGISNKINVLLEAEANYFNNYAVAELEVPLELRKNNVLIKGTLDRVSLHPDGYPVIIDYKTGEAPKQTEKKNIEKQPLKDFQMPLYIKLYEELLKADETKKGKKVEGAFYFSINKHSATPVIGNLPRKKTNSTREDYEPFLKAADGNLEIFYQAVANCRFIPREINFKDCGSCKYKTACRSVYFLNPGELPARKNGEEEEP